MSAPADIRPKNCHQCGRFMVEIAGGVNSDRSRWWTYRCDSCRVDVDVEDPPRVLPTAAIISFVRLSCTPEQHAVIVSSVRAFRAFTAPRGHQDDGAGGWLELGNCVHCPTTLSIERPEGPTSVQCCGCGFALESCTCATAEKDSVQP